MKLNHPIGVEVSKQILMVLRRNEKKGDKVIPEMYMISDQGQSLVRDKLLLKPTDRKHLLMKQSDGYCQCYFSLCYFLRIFGSRLDLKEIIR